MAIQLVFMMCPVGIGVALLRRYARAVRVRSWRRIAYLLLLWAVLAAAVFLAVISAVSGR